jgi:hypothetical protein
MKITLNFQSLKESIPPNESEILYFHRGESILHYGSVIYKWYKYDEEDCSTGISYWADDENVIDTEGHHLHLEIAEDGMGHSDDYGRLDNLSNDIFWTFSNKVILEDKDLSEIAHELWALGQLIPGEGILDGVERIKDCLERVI